MTFEQYVECYHSHLTIHQARIAVARNTLVFIDHAKDATKHKNSAGQTVLTWNAGSSNQYSVLFEDVLEQTIGNDEDVRLFAEFRDHEGNTDRFASSDEFFLFMTRYY